MTTVELCQKGLGFRVMAPSGDKQPLDVAVSTNIVKILFNPRVGISSSREPIILECVWVHGGNRWCLKNSAWLNLFYLFHGQ